MMNDLRVLIHDKLVLLLQAYFPSYSELLYNVVVLLWIGISAFLLHFILHRVVLRTLRRFQFREGVGQWFKHLGEQKLFRNIIFIVQMVLIQLQTKAWFTHESDLYHIILAISDMAIFFFALLGSYSLLNTFQSMMNLRAQRLRLPIRGIIQTVKLVLGVIFGLVIIGLVLGKSPLILISGLGAFSAVLLLVFKDPIMGLVAGIQLSANNMLMVGDWLEMPKYKADGNVIDIGLTTVKVQNWDKTITTIPTYALISDSFKNWRGMSEAGGRRIKRSLLINTSSIKFLNNEDIIRLQKSHLLAPYLEKKREDLEEDNLEQDMSFPINGRRLTNIGTFREYLLSYLASHAYIRSDMTLMVRQLDPSSQGLPLEIYAFTKTTKWTEYEGIQSDIFDHVFAVLSEFDLKAHEAPTGHDIRLLKTK